MNPVFALQAALRPIFSIGEPLRHAIFRRIWLASVISNTGLMIQNIGAAWAMGYFHRTDPAFAELQQLRDQMRAAPEADRQGLRDQFRQKMEGLTDDQRREFFQSNRGQFRQDMRRQMNEFFAMSPADQKKRLDEMIDRNIKRQKDRAAQGGGQATQIIFDSLWAN